MRTTYSQDAACYHTDSTTQYEPSLSLSKTNKTRIDRPSITYRPLTRRRYPPILDATQL